MNNTLGFWPFSSKSTASDLDRGKIALRFFYDRAMTYASLLPESFPLFLEMIDKKSPALVDGLGGLINSIDQDIGYTDSQVQAVMEKLADIGEGNMPTNWGIFQQAIGKDAADPSFWTSIKFTASETAAEVLTDVSTGLQDVGQGVMATLKLSSTMMKYLPIILVVGILGAGYIYTAPFRRKF